MRVPYPCAFIHSLTPLLPSPRTCPRLTRGLRCLVVSLAASALLPIASAAQITAPRATPPITAHSNLAADYGKLPLSFEANQGQSDPHVKYLSRGNGYSLFLTDSAAVLALTKPEPSTHAGTPLTSYRDNSQTSKVDVVRMQLAGASHPAQVAGAAELPGKTNYFIGRDSSKWHSNMPTYAKVKYTSVYPGIDLVYYGNQRQLEYDFVLHPGVTPQRIRLSFEGERQLYLNQSGDLVLVTSSGHIAFHKPVAYQEYGGQRHNLNASFRLSHKQVGFVLDHYDAREPVVIDPVLGYSTYLGGNKTDSGSDIAVDDEGNAYVVGIATSQDFPVTAGAFQTSDKAAAYPYYLPFVTKLNSTGTALIYSTYLGGTSGGDQGESIAVDSSGAAYVTGYVLSSDFPVTSGAFQQTKNSGLAAFVSKLDPAGSSLVYSTFLSGQQDAEVDGGTYGFGISVDGQGSAYVTGAAENSGFPVTPGAFQTAFKNQSGMGFVTKLDPSGSSLVYSTFLGGSILDYCFSIALDSTHHAFVTGTTRSEDFPVTPGAFQKALKSSNGGNAFATELDADGGALVYSTFLGGSGGDTGYGIAVNSSGNAFVTGLTGSYDFPVTPGAFQQYFGGPENGDGYHNAFVTKLSPGGETLAFSTYLGGDNQDMGASIAVDGSGNVLLTGETTSNNFPITEDAIQRTIAGQTAFITKMNPDGSALVYSSYFGGNIPSEEGEAADGTGIALDSAGAAYITGYSRETNLPTTPGSFQTSTNAALNGANAFITKLVFLAETAISLAPSSTGEEYGHALEVKASLSGSPAPTGSLTYTLDGGTAQRATLSSGSATLSLGILPAGSHALTVTYPGDSTYGSASQTLSFTVAKALLTATAVSFSRAYGAANPALTYTLTGFVNGDTSAGVSGSATLTTTASTSSPAGAYPITFATEALTAANYTFTYVPGTLTVTGSGSSECQTIDYSKGFTTAGLSLNNGATVTNKLLQLTDGGFYEARSAFYATAVSVTDFTTDFTFQLLYPLADGITFTIQSNNPQEVGQAGGGLGYAGIPNSIAVKADLFDNNGEGFDSTGAYLDGAYPSTPALNLFPAGIHLHSGHIFAVHISYDNHVVAATITDTVTSQSSSITVPGDLSKVVGETAYVGFTAGTGALTATQNILTWSYSGGSGCATK